MWFVTNAVGHLHFPDIGNDHPRLILRDLRLRRHVAESPMMLSDSVCDRGVEGAGAMMARIVIVMD